MFDAVPLMKLAFDPFAGAKGAFAAGASAAKIPSNAPSARRMAQMSPTGRGPEGWSFAPEKKIVRRSAHVEGGYVHGKGHNAFSAATSPRGTAHLRRVAKANPNVPVTQGTIGGQGFFGRALRRDNRFVNKVRRMGGRGGPVVTPASQRSTMMYDTSPKHRTYTGYTGGRPLSPGNFARAVRGMTRELGAHKGYTGDRSPYSYWSHSRP